MTDKPIVFIMGDGHETVFQELQVSSDSEVDPPFGFDSRAAGPEKPVTPRAVAFVASDPTSARGYAS
jgi:hypothetical protein